MQNIWGLLPSPPELRPCQNEMKNKASREGNKLAMNQKSQGMVPGLDAEQKREEI